MKKLMVIAALAAVGLVTGCQCTKIKTPEWEAEIDSHWLKRDIDKLSVQKQADGSYAIDLNGYKSDASEQFDAMMKNIFSGIAMFGRLAATVVNPAAATVPLTTEAANAADVEKITKATAELKTAQAEAKAALAKAKATQAQAKAAEAEARAQEAQANASQATEDVECDGDECIYE